MILSLLLLLSFDRNFLFLFNILGVTLVECGLMVFQEYKDIGHMLPVCTHAMVLHLLLIDQGQGLAQISVEYVERLIDLHPRVEQRSVCASDRVALAAGPEVQGLLATIGDNFCNIFNIFHSRICFPLF